jgi:hypothetical protein
MANSKSVLLRKPSPINSLRIFSITNDRTISCRKWGAEMATERVSDYETILRLCPLGLRLGFPKAAFLSNFAGKHFFVSPPP